MTLPQEVIRNMHCGLWHTPLVEAHALMPEISSVLAEAPTDPKEKYVVDVRVSMLMPNQWPCIPNWHFDNIPRDENLFQHMEQRDASKKMLCWISGEPYTEFMRPDGTIYEIEANKWYKFTQYDLHRGTPSKIHTWRVFIRITPEPLLMPGRQDQWIRRHSQVYLDAQRFKW